MSSSAFPRRFRSLIVACLAIGMICSGFSLPLISGAEAVAGSSLGASSHPTCCCGLDESCGMGCCVLRAPVVPETPVPTPRSGERPSSLSLLASQTGSWSLRPKASARASYPVRAADLLVETSLQSLQVRLDI